MFGTVGSAGASAGSCRGGILKQLLLHFCLFHINTGFPQQHNTVQHLQGDHAEIKTHTNTQAQYNIQNIYAIGQILGSVHFFLCSTKLKVKTVIFVNIIALFSIFIDFKIKCILVMAKLNFQHTLL